MAKVTSEQRAELVRLEDAVRRLETTDDDIDPSFHGKSPPVLLDNLMRELFPGLVSDLDAANNKVLRVQNELVTIKETAQGLIYQIDDLLEALQ